MYSLISRFVEGSLIVPYKRFSTKQSISLLISWKSKCFRICDGHGNGFNIAIVIRWRQKYVIQITISLYRNSAE